MKSFDDITIDIGLNKSVLENYITYSDAYYNTFYLNKKDKLKTRQIESPNAELKTIQRWILSEILNKIVVSDRANGFIPKRNIRRNSLYHLNKKFILNIDIKNFFPTISQQQVFKALNRYLNDKELAIKISKICTYKRRLPQGAPTSPMLSNIVFNNIDNEIKRFCNSNLVNYSRYADDLTFSSDNKNNLTLVYQFVNSLLYSNGFTINKNKTRYLSGKGKLEITGVIINSGRPTVGKRLKKYVRSELFQHIINGKEIEKNKIAGYISFITSVELDYHIKIKKYISDLKKKKKILVQTKTMPNKGFGDKQKDKVSDAN